MIKKIAYFLCKNEISYQTIKANNVEIDIFQGDLKAFFPTCGQRYHTIYIDGCFNTKEYELLIKECITPLASLRGGEGIIFI